MVFPGILAPTWTSYFIYNRLKNLRSPARAVMWLMFSPTLLAAWFSAKFLWKQGLQQSEPMLEQMVSFWKRLWVFEKQKTGKQP